MTSKTKEKDAVAPAPADKNGFSLICNEKLLDIYFTMLRCRMLAERTRILAMERNLTCDASAAIGHEATAVGAVIDRLPEDTLVSSPGDLAPCFIHGLPLEALFRGFFHPVAPEFEMVARLKIATDAAVANKLNKSSGIAFVVSAEELASSGPLLEALSFAGLNSLPMIFVSRKTMPPEPPVVESPTKKNGIDLKTEACAFPAIAVDGSDAVAVYRVAHEAIAHARMGHGPTLIECLTDGSNPADPILNMEKYLIRKGLFTEELKTEVIGGFSRELDAALEAASACPSSNPSTRLASC